MGTLIVLSLTLSNDQTNDDWEFWSAVDLPVGNGLTDRTRLDLTGLDRKAEQVGRSGGQNGFFLPVGVHEEGFEDVVVFDTTSGSEHNRFERGINDVDRHAGNASEALIEATQ